RRPMMFVSRVRDIHWSDASAPTALRAGASSGFVRPQVDPNTVAEIVFTSGTTGDPKGVVLTHRNIVANITPVEREVDRLRWYLWLFRPIRFLSLLPLTHM